MSDVMLHAVLNMPPNLWCDSPIDTAQRHSRYVAASKRILELEQEIEEKKEQWRMSSVCRELAHKRDELTNKYNELDGHYQKVIKAVLECDPIPACQREEDCLEPPWEVINRIKMERDTLVKSLRELADAREIVEMQKETMRQMREKYGLGERNVMRELKQQRDTLAKALETLERTAGQSTLWDDPARRNARQALAALKECEQ